MAYNIMETIKLHDLLPILDGVSDAVFIDDGAGHCVWCNSACEELYQISSSGTRGKHVKDLEKMGIFALPLLAESWKKTARSPLSTKIKTAKNC